MFFLIEFLSALDDLLT